MDYSSSVAEEPLSLSILSSFAEEPLVETSVTEESFESGATRIEESAVEVFQPLLSSTPAKRKREASIGYESSDSSRAETPLSPEHRASKEQEVEISSNAGCEDDNDMVLSENESFSGSKARSGNFEGNISNQLFPNFKNRTFFFMFEDSNFQFRNTVVDLGGKVEDFFDVLKVTDLVVKSRKTACQLVSSVEFNIYSRGQRAIKSSSKYFSSTDSYDGKIVDVADKNDISVYSHAGQFLI